MLYLCILSADQLGVHTTALSEFVGRHEQLHVHQAMLIAKARQPGLQTLCQHDSAEHLPHALALIYMSFCFFAMRLNES